MAHQLTDLGEEFCLETALEGVSVEIGLYNDSSNSGADDIQDSDDLASITTEPTGSTYARQSTTLTLSDNSGDWQAETSAQVTFDVSSCSEDVDSYFIVANFQADDTGDGGATDHLIATGALSQLRDLSQIDTLNISAGTAGFKLT
jgi:hypothetical protein